MKRLAGDFVYEMSKSKEPALEIKPGDKLQVETPDAFGGQIESPQDTLADLDMSRINPATGPVYVASASPGDTLVLKIEEIEVKSPGVQGIVPGFGFLQDEYDQSMVTTHKIDQEGIEFDGFTLPVKPMIGTIGVAPPEEPVPCNTPGRHGGNLDTPEIRAGATLYLPVFHEGGLFALGDGHALQGDGEVCGVAIEVATTTTLEVGLLGEKMETPMVQVNDEIIFLGSGKTISEAGKKALKAMIKYLEKETSLSSSQAYKFCSVACDMKISQVVNPQKTVRVSVNKKLL
ncbi:MAG: acetamidase/formamidase family protein [Candidatus Bipolaricaulota bacterium]